MKKNIITTLAICTLAVSCSAQKADGLVYGGSASVGWPLLKMGHTHKIGFGGDVLVEYKPKYNPGEGFFDFNIWNSFNYTFSAGYMMFPGKDSIASGQKFKRDNYSILPLLIGVKAVFDRKYVNIQLGWSFLKYTKISNAFTYAFNWGILLQKLDLSFRFQGTIKEIGPPGFFLGIRAGLNSDVFLER